MAKKKIEIDVVVDDKGTTKKVALSQKQLEDALGKTEKGAGRASKQQRALMETAQGTGKNFANLASSISGGIVPAYAAFAAQVFAVTAAFQFLQEAANVRNLIAAQEEYAGIIGTSFPRITKALQDATLGQLRYQDAAQATAIGTAAGLNQKQLVGLAEAAKNASFALGRPLEDSFNRLIRGVTKAEPELLDELGIILRLKPATEEYAASIGKTVDQLSAFERTQAVANFTLDQADRKLGQISKVIDEDALAVQKFMKAFDDLSNSIKIAVVNVISPVLTFLSNNILALIGTLTIFTAPLVKSVIPDFEAFGKASKRSSRIAQKALGGLREELGEMEKAAASLSKNQDKYIEKATKLADKADVSKLGPGKEGGGAGVDFLTGQSKSKAAQRNAGKILSNARKQIDAEGKILTGKLKGYNKEQLRDLERSYALRVKAASSAATQISTRWKTFTVNNKVRAKQFQVAWTKAFAFVAKQGKKLPGIIDRAFRAASFIGLAFLLFDLGKMAFDFFFPAKKQAEELDDAIQEVNSRLEDTEKHLDKVVKYRLSGSFSVEERIIQLGNAARDADIPQLVEDIDQLNNITNKNSKEYKTLQARLVGTTDKLVILDSRFVTLNDAAKEGKELTTEQQQAMLRLGVGLQSAGAATAELTDLQKALNAELAQIVKGVPQAPLQNLLVAYDTYVKGTQDSQKNVNVILDDQLRAIATMEKLNAEYDNFRGGVSGGETAADKANILRNFATTTSGTRQPNEETRRAALDLADRLIANAKESQKLAEQKTAIDQRNLRIEQTRDRIRDSMNDQLIIEKAILANDLQRAQALKAGNSFDARRVKIATSILPLINSQLKAEQNLISAKEQLTLVETEGSRVNGVTKQQAEDEKTVAETLLAIAKENLRLKAQEMGISIEDLRLEEEKLGAIVAQNDARVKLKQIQRDRAFDVDGAGSIGKSRAVLANAKQRFDIAEQEAKIEIAQQAVTAAEVKLLQEKNKTGERNIVGANLALNIARIQLGIEQDMLKTKQASVDLSIDALRLRNEDQQRLAQINMLDPVQREMEEFLISTGQTRANLSAEQLANLEKQIRTQQKLKVVTEGLKNIQQTFTNGLADSIAALDGGIKSMRNAFLDMARNVVDALNQVIAKMIAMRIASSVFSAFAPTGGPPTSTEVLSNTGIQDYTAYLPGKRYGGIMEPYRTGGIARGRDAGFPAILHGTEAVVPLGQGAKSIPVEFIGRGGQNQQNNVTVNVAMSSDGTVQSQTSTEDQGNVGKAIALAVQQELHKQKRPGGMLSPYGAGSG